MGIELPDLFKTRKLFIVRFVESYKTDTNAEPRYTAGTPTWAWVCA